MASEDSKNIHKQLRHSHHHRRHMIIRTRSTSYGFRNFVRNTWLSVAATAVMTITLLFLFVAVIISQMLSNTVVIMNEKINDVTIFFKSETSDDTLRVLAGKMKMTENVIPDSVEYENSSAVFNKYIEENKYDQVAMGQINLIVESGVDLSDIFPSRLAFKIKNPNNIAPIKKVVENDTDFKEWLSEEAVYKPSYDKSSTKNTVEKIIGWSNLAQKIGIGAGSILLLISILIIFNTIRMAIFSRREEIDMMRTIGADKHFIRGPFLIEAQMYGFFAAIISTVIGYFGIINVLPEIERHGIAVSGIGSLMTTWWYAIFGAMMFIGMTIGYVSARLAVRKYLK
ncbi:FtsX-like permease family protein [Candidatus Saccharibacteria bacterium]|nr:FtsX-like permease family protein [Candidatus Saccharibacteria bacterium]MCL1962761.1 FtsX-like permease family protein [Candidatus Saccharibacteria bacterium]